MKIPKSSYIRTGAKLSLHGLVCHPVMECIIPEKRNDRRTMIERPATVCLRRPKHFSVTTTACMVKALRIALCQKWLYHLRSVYASLMSPNRGGQLCSGELRIPTAIRAQMVCPPQMHSAEPL